jgi:hypothetical protein
MTELRAKSLVVQLRPCLTSHSNADTIIEPISCGMKLGSSCLKHFPDEKADLGHWLLRADNGTTSRYFCGGTATAAACTTLYGYLGKTSGCRTSHPMLLLPTTSGREDEGRSQ